MNSQILRPAEPLEHRSLNKLEGLWKVVHHGNLIPPVAPEKTPRLVIYFRKLAIQNKPVTPADFETQGPAVAIRVPAAELMRLPLNAVIHNSRLALDPCLPLPSEEMDTLEVDVSKSKTKFINRYAQVAETDEFIIPYNDGRSPSPDSEGGRAYYVAIEYNGDPFGILIPCAEVFRFFYCTSSRMLYTILSDKILDPDRFIIDPAKSGKKEGEETIAVVWLRQWMLNSDRRHIARLFFTPGAFEEAKNIFLRTGGYVDEGVFERAIIALPPSHGRMDLKCTFKRFVSDGRERIFVTRLISALNWTIPFLEIHYGRDNDGRSVLTNGERDSLQDDQRRQRPSVLAKGAEISILEDTSADNSIDPIEIEDAEFESRFPDLEKIYSPQIEKTDQKTKNNKGKKYLSLADGSLVEGSSTAHDGLVNTILLAMEKAAEIQQEQQVQKGASSGPLEELDVAPSSKIFERIEHIETARTDRTYSERLTVTYLPVLDRLGLLKGKVLNVLPNSIDGKSPAWLFLDGSEKLQPRPVLVVSLSLNNRIRYLIDFMHQDGHSDTASLLLWHPDEIQIPDHLLKYAIRTCMRNRSVNLKDGDLLKNLCGRPIKHTFREKQLIPKHTQLIEKVFAAENRITKWISG